MLSLLLVLFYTLAPAAYSLLNRRSTALGQAEAPPTTGLQAIDPGLADNHALLGGEGAVEPRLQPQAIEQGTEADGREVGIEALPALLRGQPGQQPAQLLAVLAIGMIMHLVDRIGRLDRAPKGQPGVEQLRVQQLCAKRGAENADSRSWALGAACAMALHAAAPSPAR